MAKSKHFIVVLCGDFSQRLKIPRKFLKNIEEALSKQEKGLVPMTLTDANGRTWCVSIKRDAHGAHFTLGWPKFAQEHKLRENEFLAFQYDGNRQFSVIIFEDSMCEREISDKGDESWSPEVVSLTESDSERSESREDIEVMSEDDQEDDSDYESDSSFMNEYSRKKGGSAAFSNPSSKRKMRGRYVSCHRAVTDLEKQKAAAAAFSFSSKNPHFMLCMSANMVYRWSSLRFPIRFSKDHLPKEKAKFVLRNSAGQKWACSYYTEGVKPSAKGLISRGWAHFARDNNLEEDDYCVFELVKRREFFVHIFRVVDKLVPRVWLPRPTGAL